MRWILPLLLLIGSAWAKPAPDSVLLLNTSTNHIELSRNADRVRSIASLTKIMTAMVALDYDKDLSRRLTLTQRVGSFLPRQQYTREQLLEAMLVKSDNAAAETLAEDYPGGRTAFIAVNKSTVLDIANLMHIASGYWFIRDTSVKKQVAFETRYKKQIRTIRLSHTSESILFTFDNILVSKTGLTSAAGWCVGLVVQQNNKPYVIVVLGSANKTQRLQTVKNIIYNHVLDQNLQHF